jgi:hypothetical protein
MANRFEFQKWVPAAACRELESQAEQELADYSLLHRLATYQVMRDDVWSKVAAEKADIVIHQVVACARAAGAWQILHRNIKHLPHSLVKDAARSAKKLLHDMEQANGDLSLSWPLWPDDRQIMTEAEFPAAFESARAAVNKLATFYSRVDEQYQEIIAASNELSWVLRKKNQKKAQEIFFQRWLMNRFRALLGKPLDTVVTALSSVVFDQDAGVGSSTIRGRRRSAPGAAHSGKKLK